MYLANVNIGQTVNISCLFQEGFPKPSFKWTYGLEDVIQTISLKKQLTIKYFFRFLHI